MGVGTRGHIFHRGGLPARRRTAPDRRRKFFGASGHGFISASILVRFHESASVRLMSILTFYELKRPSGGYV